MEQQIIYLSIKPYKFYHSYLIVQNKQVMKNIILNQRGLLPGFLEKTFKNFDYPFFNLFGAIYC